jgi:hypothetical protein
MTIGTRRLVKMGVAAAAAVAALVLFIAPQASASASAGSSVHGFSSSGLRFVGLTTCQDEFTGPVTSDDGSGGIAARIDRISFTTCDAGASVTPNALPWTLKLQEDSNYTIEGFNVTITTPRGICRYSGSVRGDMQFPGGAYNLTGSLTRNTAGCGGSDRLTVDALIEVITING